MNREHIIQDMFLLCKLKQYKVVTYFNLQPNILFNTTLMLVYTDKAMLSDEQPSQTVLCVHDKWCKCCCSSPCNCQSSNFTNAPIHTLYKSFVQRSAQKMFFFFTLPVKEHEKHSMLEMPFCCFPNSERPQKHYIKQSNHLTRLKEKCTL